MYMIKVSIKYSTNYLTFKQMKRFLTLLGFVIFSFSLSFGQQDLIMTQYMTNLLPTNGAYAGTSGRLNTTFLSRHQWVGFEGAPTTNVLVINSPLIKRNFGVGLTVIQDKVGPLTQTLAFGDLAYNFQITEKLRVSMGIKAGFNIQQPDFSTLDINNPNDPNFAVAPEVELLPNFGFGIYVYNPKYYFGISSPKLKRNKMNLGSVGQESGSEERHYYVIGGYVFDLTSNLKYRPTVFFKAVKGAPMSFESTHTLILNDKLWLGAMWRVGDALGAMIQYNIYPAFKVGYSYDFTTSKLSQVSGGTHEILVSYDLVFRKQKIVTPRYF